MVLLLGFTATKHWLFRQVGRTLLDLCLRLVDFSYTLSIDLAISRVRENSFFCDFILGSLLGPCGKRTREVARSRQPTVRPAQRVTRHGNLLIMVCSLRPPKIPTVGQCRIGRDTEIRRR